MIGKFLAGLVLAATVLAPVAEACTRVTYLGPEGRVLTGRSMCAFRSIRSAVPTTSGHRFRGIRSPEPTPLSVVW